MQLQLTMSKFKEMTATKKHKNHKKAFCAFCASLWLILICVGCRRDMQDQPKMKPLRGTTFFGDGLSSRRPIEGTIPRGYLRENSELYTGKKSGTAIAAPAQQQTAGTQANSFPDDVEIFPIPVTKEVVLRGRERYDIFCSACHGLT